MLIFFVIVAVIAGIFLYLQPRPTSPPPPPLPPERPRRRGYSGR